MAREMVTRRAYCKFARFLNGSGQGTLQEKMVAAFGKLRTVGKRKQVSGDDATYVRTVIYHRSYAGMLFGILASYERGTFQLTVSDDDDAEVLTVAQVAPPKSDDNKRQEFLEGTCYFGILRNHVVLVGSRALGAKPTEQYLNWLLERAGLLGPDNQVFLSDQISSATRERIKASHVKQVEIGMPLIEGATEQSVTTVAGRKVTAFEYSGLGIDILRSVLGAERLDRMRLADAVDGNIEVSLKVRYKRTTTDKAHAFLDNVALAVRNVDEDEVKLTLAKGGTVQGSELRLSAQVSVEARDGIPNPDVLFQKMHTWLMQQIQHKIIEP